MGRQTPWRVDYTAIMTTIEERKEKLIRLRAIRGTQCSIVTKNVTKANDIVEDETLTTGEQVQHLEVISRLMKRNSKLSETSIKKFCFFVA